MISKQTARIQIPGFPFDLAIVAVVIGAMSAFGT
jgi:hypothetical protein